MTATAKAEDQPRRAAASSGLLCPSIYYPRQPVDSFIRLGPETGGLGGHGARAETGDGGPGITSVEGGLEAVAKRVGSEGWIGAKNKLKIDLK